MRKLIQSLRIFWKFLGELPMAGYPHHMSNLCASVGLTDISALPNQGSAPPPPDEATVASMSEWLKAQSAQQLKE